VDVEGYVALHTNRYSVPLERIGRRVEVRETKDKIEIQLDARRLVTHGRIAEAEHQRILQAQHRPPRGQGICANTDPSRRAGHSSDGPGDRRLCCGGEAAESEGAGRCPAPTALRTIGDITLDDVLTLLSDLLRSLRQPPFSARRYGRVFVGTAKDAFGMSFEVVFTPGLSEGMFPRPIAEDPLLLNDARKQVSASLRLARDEDERGLLRAILAAARTACICSYPRMDFAPKLNCAFAANCAQTCFSFAGCHNG
jgi:Mu transposase, C-terminal domain